MELPNFDIGLDSDVKFEDDEEFMAFVQDDVEFEDDEEFMAFVHDDMKFKYDHEFEASVEDDIKFEDDEEFEAYVVSLDSVILQEDGKGNNSLKKKSETTSTNRLDMANIGVGLETYLKNKEPAETKKATEQAVRLYDSVMSSLAMEQKTTFKSLKDTPVEELPESLGKFLMLAKKRNGDVFNASSLCTYFQSLCRFLATDYSPKLEVKTDKRFKMVRDILNRRCTDVAEQGGRPGMNASKAVSYDTLKLAYEHGTLGRSNPKALVTTVHYNMVSGFGCRAIAEIYMIKNEDITNGPETQPGLPKYMQLSERVTKTRRGRKNEVRDIEGRIYLDNDHPEICPVRNMLEFQRRKTKFQNSPGQPFFFSIKQSAQANPAKEPFWYTNGRMGINHIGNLFKQAFVAVGVDVKAEKITATSGRKNLLQTGADGLVPGGFLSKMAGQKNLDTKLSYIENKENSHQAASLVIQRRGAGISGSSFPVVFKQLQEGAGYGPAAGVGAGSGAGARYSPAAGVGAKSGAGTLYGPAAGVWAGSGTRAGYDLAAGAGAGSGAGAGYGHAAGIGAGSGAVAGYGTWAGSGTGAGYGPGTGAGNGYGPAVGEGAVYGAGAGYGHTAGVGTGSGAVAGYGTAAGGGVGSVAGAGTVPNDMTPIRISVIKSLYNGKENPVPKLKIKRVSSKNDDWMIVSNNK